MFQKATKKQAKLRLAIYAPSGAGKTYTALRIATGLGGKIALIDSERGSASKYADNFNFDVAELEKFGIENYVQYIKMAHEYDVLIIDSLSHAWHELLTEIDKLASAKYKGNSFMAWSEGTPKQRMFVDAILNFPGHVIATMRTKTEWSVEKDANSGKTKPVKLGLAPEQGKGIEYEFDILMEINHEHYATIAKDRTGKFQDAEILKPSEEFGKTLSEWLNSGEAVISNEEKIQNAINEANQCTNLDDLTLVWRKYGNYQQIDVFRAAITELTTKLKSAQQPIAAPDKIEEPQKSSDGVVLENALMDIKDVTDMRGLDEVYKGYPQYHNNPIFNSAYQAKHKQLFTTKSK